MIIYVKKKIDYMYPYIYIFLYIVNIYATWDRIKIANLKDSSVASILTTNQRSPCKPVERAACTLPAVTYKLISEKSMK